MKRKIGILLLSATAVGLGLALINAGWPGRQVEGFNSAPRAVADPVASPVTMAAAALSDGPSDAAEPMIRAVLYPASTVGILSETAGILAGITVAEGELVRPRQTVAVFKQDEANFAVRQREARVQIAAVAVERQRAVVAGARSELQQSEELRRAGLLSERELNRNRLALTDKEKELERLIIEHEMAQSELVHSRRELAQTVVTAPAGGRVLRIYANPGMAVKTGDRLMDVADPKRLQTRFRVPASLWRPRIGTAVEIFDEDRNPLGTAVIRSVSATALPPESALEYEAQVPVTPKLFPGVTILIRLPDREAESMR
ncbi:MAG TPA: HlyD family efflux transporter periplasmic adaptor subunit [Blastocatellia bacterium]|nr:HlyD family efflux transporter periplasmic adaptor subunit [Blastocatellia bacterium]